MNNGLAPNGPCLPPMFHVPGLFSSLGVSVSLASASAAPFNLLCLASVSDWPLPPRRPPSHPRPRPRPRPPSSSILLSRHLLSSRPFAISTLVCCTIESILIAVIAIPPETNIIHIVLLIAPNKHPDNKLDLVAEHSALHPRE